MNGFSVGSRVGMHRDSQSTPSWASNRHRWRDRTSIVACGFAAVLWLATCIAGAVPTAAEDLSKTQMRSLDEQVQDIKTDVLTIAAELSALEEKLLYPSDTQVAVFVSLARDESAQLDSVEIQIDGQPVARHIYSFKEVEALGKGGVQRIYTGNIPTGRHQFDVSISGKRGAGKDFELLGSFAFSKEVDPKLVGITLSSNTVGSTSIEIEDW